MGPLERLLPWWAQAGKFSCWAGRGSSWPKGALWGGGGGGSQAPTSVEDFDDGVGFVDVQLQVLEPAVVHKIQEDIEPVLEGAVGFLLPPAGFVRVILGLEPGGREGGGSRGKRRGRRRGASAPQGAKAQQSPPSISHACKARWGGGGVPGTTSFCGGGRGGGLPEEAPCWQGSWSPSERQELGSAPAPFRAIRRPT